MPWFLQVNLAAEIAPNTPSTSTISSESPALSPSDRIRTVLVVDDNKLNRRAQTITLMKQVNEGIAGIDRFQNIKYLEAEDGQQAVDIYLKENVDCIIMDCKMPVMDGIAATKVSKLNFSI